MFLHGGNVLSKNASAIDHFLSSRNGLVELAEVGKILNILRVVGGFKTVENGGCCNQDSNDG